jgi:hypothetical protein
MLEIGGDTLREMASRSPLALFLALAWVACGDRDREEERKVELAPATATATSNGCAIRAELVPDPPSARLGDDRFVVFRATTDCAKGIGIIEGGNTGNRLQRDNAYRVSAIDGSGAEIPKVDAKNDQGGANGVFDFTNTQPREARLRLSDWVVLSRPGRYQITVERGLELGKQPGVRETVDWVPVKVAAVIEITP